MPRKIITAEGFKNQTIREMKSLGVYKQEFDTIIGIYSGLLEQYTKLNKKYLDSNMDFEVDTMQGGTKKAPIVATLEVLRKDILNYACQLGLTVKGLDSIEVEKEKAKSKLEQALEDLSKPLLQEKPKLKKKTASKKKQTKKTKTKRNTKK